MSHTGRSVDKWFIAGKSEPGDSSRVWALGPVDRLAASVHSNWANVDQAACKPGSVHGLATDGRPFLWDGPCGPPHATNPDGTRRRACRTLPEGLARRPSLFGLAPGGACLAIPVTRDAVRSYRTLSPLPQGPARKLTYPGAVCFLWRFPSNHFGRTLSAALPTWSPDFPPAVACQRSPGRLIEPGSYHPRPN